MQDLKCMASVKHAAKFKTCMHECRCLRHVTKEIFKIQLLEISFGINFGRNNSISNAIIVMAICIKLP